jgi:hypothetical protein
MSSNNWCPIACRHVTLLCEQFDARIVISSTWRYNHTEDELRELLSDNNIVPGLMIGTTPSLIHEEELGSVSRGDEIASWLKDNENSVSSYVIIDDAPPSQFLENQQPNLVHVEQEKGFAQKEAAVKAGEILATDTPAD